MRKGSSASWLLMINNDTHVPFQHTGAKTIVALCTCTTSIESKTSLQCSQLFQSKKITLLQLSGLLVAGTRSGPIYSLPSTMPTYKSSAL